MGRSALKPLNYSAHIIQGSSTNKSTHAQTEIQSRDEQETHRPQGEKPPPLYISSNIRWKMKKEAERKEKQQEKNVQLA